MQGVQQICLLITDQYNLGSQGLEQSCFGTRPNLKYFVARFIFF